MFTLNVAYKLISLVRLNCVIRKLSIEYLGSFGLKTKNVIAANMPMMTSIDKMRQRIQHKHLQQQFLLFLGLGYGEGG